MAGLINPNILRNPKTPLNQAATQGPVASTAQPLTVEVGPPKPKVDQYGYPIGAIGWKNLSNEEKFNFGQEPAREPSAPGFDADAWANNPWSAGEQTPAQNGLDAVVGATKGVAQNYQNDVAPVLPTGGDIDWDAWSKTPWNEPKPPVKGVLEDPGPVEQAYDQAKDKFYTPGDKKTQEWIDRLGGRESLGEPDLDAWYDREWKRAQGSLNAQAAARGQSGSTDVMRMLNQSREGLAADQAKETAEFMQHAFDSDTERYKLAAGLQGEVSDADLNELDSWMRAANMAQQGEEGRVGMQIDDLMKGFNMAFSGVIKGWDDLLDADKELIQQIIMAGPAPATERANQEAKLSENAKAALGEILKLQSGGV